MEAERGRWFRLRPQGEVRRINFFLFASKMLNVINFSRKQRQKNGRQKNGYGFSLFHGEHFFDDTKPHFSVFVFVQVNLTLPGSTKENEQWKTTKRSLA